MKHTVLPILFSLLIGHLAMAQQGSAQLTSTSDGTLQWLLRPIVRPSAGLEEDQKSESYQLLLHKSDRDDLGTWREVGKLNGNVQLNSLAAGGAGDQRLYAVFGESQVFRFDRIPRHSQNTTPASALQMDIVRMRVQLMLPRTGEIHNAVTDSQGYWLLLEPKLTVEALATRQQTPQDSRVLMQLTDDKWIEHPLPEAVLDLEQLQLISLGRPQMLGFIGVLKDQLVIVSQQDQGQWASQTVPLEVKSQQQIQWLNLNGHRVVAVSEQVHSQWLIQLKLLIDDQVLELGEFDLPQELMHQWTLLGVGDKVGLMTLSAQNQLTLRTLDLQGKELEEPIEIKVDDPTDMMNQPGRMLVSVALMAAVFIMFSIWRRDPANAKVTLPKGYRIAPISRRFLALMIDLAPCAILSAWLTGVTLQQMIDQWPGVAITWEQLIPGLLTIGLFVIHTTVTEVFTAKTLGKKIMGLCVCTMDGKSPNLWQMILRNLLKILDLIAWYILPVLVIISAYRQRLGDVVARTLVVEPEPEDEDA